MLFVEIFHDFGWFFATRIRIRFIEADPIPADQNETDPNGSGSATLILSNSDENPPDKLSALILGRLRELHQYDDNNVTSAAIEYLITYLGKKSREKYRKYFYGHLIRKVLG